MATALFMLMTRRVLRRERTFRDRNNPLEFLDDKDNVDMYGLIPEAHKI